METIASPREVGQHQRRVAPMRLLFAANFAPDRGTGIGNHLFSLAEALGRRGHTVDFLMRDAIPAAQRAGRASRLVFPVLLVRDVRARRRRGIRYDAVNIHEPSGMPYAVARQWSNDLPPLVLTTHGVEQRDWQANFNENPRSLLTRLTYPLTELLQANYGLRHADAVACLSDEDAKFLHEKLGVPGERIHRMANGVDPVLLDLGWETASQPRLLFLGTWMRRKGSREIVQAFSALRARYPWLRLTVAGSGLSPAEVLGEFAEADRAAVEVLPRLSRDEIRGVLANDQIFLLPSLFEGMPLSLLEAMAAALPCVTTHTCGMVHLVEDGKNGRLVLPRDARALENAILSLLDSPEQRRALGEAARVTAAAHTWDRVAEDWEALFAKAARIQPRRYILRDGCWSDEIHKAPQQRLAENLVELSQEVLQSADPCAEMATWQHLDFRGDVLDLGSGTGWKTHCLNLRDGTRAIGCDYDLSLLRYCRRKHAGVPLLQCDAQELPFAAESFDWVIAVEVVEHLPSPERFLQEITRVLRPGGRMLVTTPNRLQYLRPWRPRWFWRGLRQRIVIEPSHVREYTAEALKPLLPPQLQVQDVRYRGTLTGWPRRIEVESLPSALKRLWAQGFEIVARKAAGAAGKPQ